MHTQNTDLRGKVDTFWGTNYILDLMGRRDRYELFSSFKSTKMSIQTIFTTNFNCNYNCLLQKLLCMYASRNHEYL